MGDCKNPTQEIGLGRDNEIGSTTLMAGQTMRGTGFKARDLDDFAEWWMRADYFDHYSGSHPPCPHISLTTEDVTRYKMAWRAVEFFRHTHSEGAPVHRSSRGRWWHEIPPALVQRCKDWPSIDNVVELPVGLGFTTAGLIYGGLHALAWFAYFESSTRQLLWRISVCVVMGGFPVLWVLMESAECIDNNFTDQPHLDIIYEGFMFIAAVLVLLAYMLARAYLVVECFINLSHLPAGVYDIPKWASYFPHIS